MSNVMMPGGKVGNKIAIGSYTGNGKYGDADACKLSFDFTPKLVVVVGRGYYNSSSEWIAIPFLLVMPRPSDAPVKKITYTSWTVGDSSFLNKNDPHAAAQAYYIIAEWGEKNVVWYGYSGSDMQGNYKGFQYDYIALG